MQLPERSPREQCVSSVLSSGYVAFDASLFLSSASCFLATKLSCAVACFSVIVVSVSGCMYVCMYVCMHACMYVRMHACMHAC